MPPRDRSRRASQLRALDAQVRKCTLCRLCRSRALAVPGEGPLDPPLFLIGEAPGRAEDATGRPFVGPAGRVLEDALRGAGLRREDVFITSIQKCRPPGNRAPRADEVDACRPYLFRQIELVRPRAIATLGRYGLKGLFGAGVELAAVRGETLWHGEIPVLPTIHPAAVLYRRPLHRVLRDDLERVIRWSRAKPINRRSQPLRRDRPTRRVRSAGVVLYHGRRILLLRRRDEHLWGFPKGHLEAREDDRAAALRELREETGLNAVLESPIGLVRYRFFWPPDDANHDKVVRYFLARRRGGRLRLEATFEAARWSRRDEAMALLRYDNDRRMAAQAFTILAGR